uniref:Cyclic nucleotide-binding domain-containing protein n=1 Tax=Chenopodium quinoa TaxID=63459 RepID=A0A803MX49_CHEQI
MIWFIVPALRSGTKAHTNHTVALIVLVQFIPRLFVMFPLNRKIVNSTGIAAKNAWSGAVYNMLLFILAGHNYLQSIMTRIEEWRIRRRDTEEWMQHIQLPEELRERIRRFVQYKWLATRGVDEESILQSLPLDIRREIQKHLCLGLVRRVPFFAQMDDQLLDAICERLIPSLSTKDTYIAREGDPVSEMMFIIRGQLESSTTYGGRSGFFNSITLRQGDFCGEELLTWAILPTTTTLNLPSSTRKVKAITEVEAFALRADDLKYVATQFKRLQSKKLQHSFRVVERGKDVMRVEKRRVKCRVRGGGWVAC